MADPVLVHEAMLDAAGALGILRRQALGGLSVSRILGGLRPDRLAGLDLVFVPHWYCCFRVTFETGARRPGADRAAQVAPAVWVMVEALAGQVLRLAGEPPLVGRDLATLAPA